MLQFTQFTEYVFTLPLSPRPPHPRQKPRKKKQALDEYLMFENSKGYKIIWDLGDFLPSFLAKYPNLRPPKNIPNIHDTFI
jgi:hypothetical protein